MKELEHIGKEGMIKHSELSFEVKIKDVKSSYGRIRYLVSPTSGQGQMWVESIIIK